MNPGVGEALTTIIPQKSQEHEEEAGVRKYGKSELI